MKRTQFFVAVGMILSAAAMRLVPHPPNFTPIAAMALFGGAHFSTKRMALSVALGAMLLSDVVLGLHDLMPFVYGSFALTVLLGAALRNRGRWKFVVSASLAASTLFFLITNFGVWAIGGLYPRSASGLVACYMAAIPFFGWTLAGDLFYTGAWFGAYFWLEKRVLGKKPNLFSAGITTT